MGLSSSKSKTVQSSDPWAPAQPYILNGLQQTQDVFQANQPTLQAMSTTAQDAYNQIAPLALGTNAFAQAAQNVAQGIAGGKYLGTNPGASAFSSLMQPGNDPAMGTLSALAQGSRSPGRYDGIGSGNPALASLSSLTGGGANDAAPGLAALGYAGPGLSAQAVRATNAPNPGNAIAARTAAGTHLSANPAAAFHGSELSGANIGRAPSATFYADTLGGKYLNANPYLDGIVTASNNDATRALNARFAASGMGEGISTAYAGALGSALSDNENRLRYQAYSDELARMGQIGGQSDSSYQADRSRQLAAAEQADSAFSAERDRMGNAASLLSANANAAADRGLSASQANAANALDAAKTNAGLRLSALGQLSDANQHRFDNALGAATALGSLYDRTGQLRLGAQQAQDSAFANDRAAQLAAATALGSQYGNDQQIQLGAAKAADEAYAAQLAQITQALGLVPGLADAQYAGIAPALSLLNAAATAPYLGISAYNGGINGLSQGYGTQSTTTKSSPSLIDMVRQAGMDAAKMYATGGGG